MSKLKNMVGEKHNRLTVIARAENNARGLARWICVCDCGNTVEVSGNNLRTGQVKSCGCLNTERLVKRNTKHGGATRESSDRLYHVWRGIIGRCYDPNNNSFRWYGARNIGVCDDWKTSYSSFRAWALGNGYDPNAERGACTIDRIDVNGNYTPQNCRWISMNEQNKNRRIAV